MNLVLVGYRGTGKSAIAQRLCELLGMPRVSLDEEIVRLAGLSIPKLVADLGWSHFRDLEDRVCREFGNRDGQVIDCGGGVVEREVNLTSLRSRGRVFWLRASPATIIGRIGDDRSRPSLTGNKSFLEEVEEVLRRRLPLYQRIAHVEVDTEGRTIDELAADIAHRFRVPAPEGDGMG